MHVAKEHELDAGQKGNLGEGFARDWLASVGTPFRAERYHDQLDFHQVGHDQKAYYVEVKTYELWKPWMATGIDFDLYQKYIEFSHRVGIENIKFIWVDWELGQIYGNWWTKLEQKYWGKGGDNLSRCFPRRWKTSEGEKIMYHYGQMEKYADLRPSQREKLRVVTHKKPYLAFTVFPDVDDEYPQLDL